MHLIKKLLIGGCLSFFILFSNAATALNTSEATKLISSLVKDINIIINSKKPATYMYLDFKNVLFTAVVLYVIVPMDGIEPLRIPV